MKKNILLVVVLLQLFQYSNAQDTIRTTPKEWNNLVYGGRFMDRLLPLKKVGELTSDTWGANAVKPRDIKNGIEEKDWSYWGGNIIIDEEGKHHLFVCRWREDDPKGHMAWPKSEVVHTVSDNAIGPYKVVEVIGPGHNPEIQQLKDGSYFLYIHRFGKYNFYHSKSLNGPWKLKPFNFEMRDRQLEDHMSNNTFAKRKDGSLLMVGRGGGIWISESGLTPFKKVSTKSVYPPFEGKYEDPVVWKTNIQYHLIVNDWLGRIAYYMRSKDGFHWKLDAGEAYLPKIAKHKNGQLEDWYKFERIKVLQDNYGRAYQTNFAVADTIKKQDKGSDNHSSKNISIPLTVGKLIELVGNDKIDTATKEFQLLIKAEADFNPHKDINVKSLRYGASEVVNFGGGSKVIKKEKKGKDLLLTFEGKGNGFAEANFAGKLLGKTKKGKLLFGFSRLPWINYDLPMLSSKFPEFTQHSRNSRAVVEIENFGEVTSKPSTILIEYQSEGKWKTFVEGVIPEIEPYQKTKLTFSEKKIGNRNDVVMVRISILQEEQQTEILEGAIVIR